MQTLKTEIVKYFVTIIAAGIAAEILFAKAKRLERKARSLLQEGAAQIILTIHKPSSTPQRQ